MPPTIEEWAAHVDCLYDAGEVGWHRLPGVSPGDVLPFALHDYDEVDAIYTDHEVLGGE